MASGEREIGRTMDLRRFQESIGEAVTCAPITRGETIVLEALLETSVSNVPKI